MKHPLSITNLDLLEAEAIHIFREVAAEATNPVFLYSVGKDSAVMLHLALKAFFPAKPPFKFLHVDTKWKFREMISFRDRRMKELGLDLIVHTNPDGLENGVGPLTHGAAHHTEIMKRSECAHNSFNFSASPDKIVFLSVELGPSVGMKRRFNSGMSVDCSHPRRDLQPFEGFRETSLQPSP